MAPPAVNMPPSACPPDATMDQQVRAWATVPLNFQPGTQWQYTNQVGFGILGRIVELVSGMPLERFFETRIFAPLDMSNTFYQIPPDRQDDTAVLYTNTESTLVRAPAPTTSGAVGGAGGLWSTAEDYFTFAQMLLDGGSYKGHPPAQPEKCRVDERQCDR